ncbi:ras-related and estrogen-regulated growth inhibitor isoform X1 [Zootermopsis nevadensis]|uniref:ras-related and estrogen-regulated growth inhibitor isoform X1 n=1 Tax=Zootermopsis nevadensis TaxID=136037 RepID=UPI000B8E6766|nr:ras-related and estrogen-regulated growth inhibitor isoform X1 [Zootermopsis nevadensis]XP_021928211.1 ras-related and estrogen-regulated growth inhibitor isoform X1 [Zootermopsis nevadensis]XP_021928222.1 ras-related and estrogen-regulated growth inhibitor isoform X1 [Zootermopsis nevadensis]
MTASSSPKSSFCKIGLCSRQKPLKVMVLGQGGVGKSALVVRFITRRYIGEYDPNLEKVYTFHTVMDNEMVLFEILDTAGQPHESECLTLEANIRWAEAFILMYSVTDKCSFDECNRLKFLINYNKRRRRLGSNSSKVNGNKETVTDVPVVLVGNKTDQWGDRMVSLEEGQRRSKEIGCVCFHEISVRESIEQVWSVFRDVCRFWKVHSKCPKIKRSSSDLHTEQIVSPDSTRFICTSKLAMNGTTTPNGSQSAVSPVVVLGRRWTEVELDEEEESDERRESEASSSESLPPFRGRASTDGHLLSRPRRWRYPPPAPSSQQQYHQAGGSKADRRMSISMRGNNASY